MDVTLFPVAVLSCVAFLIFYKYVSPVVSAWISPGYKSLSLAKQVEWDTRTNSTLHSLIVCSITLHVCFYDDVISIDPVWGDSPTVRTNCAIVIGYMFSDLIIIMRHYKEIGEMFYLFHHAAAIYAYYFVMTYGVLPWFANFRLLAELSTPFVNQRWFMDALGCSKTTPLFIGNGLAMTSSFILVRICSMPFYWYKVYSIYGTPPCIELGRIWYVLISSCFVLDIINIFWCMKMVRGSLKVIQLMLSKPPEQKPMQPTPLERKAA